MAYTVTYSPSLPDRGGWPSFYGYNPEFMIGMNSDFFTFKNGNINIHNQKASLRATFYLEENTDGDTSITPFTTPYIETVFNEKPLETDVYKALRVSATVPVGGTLAATTTTDLHNGTVGSDQFEKKENSFYSYIRQPITDTQVDMRFAQGIGVCNANTVANSIQFDLTSINSMVGIGDRILTSGTLTDLDNDGNAVETPNQTPTFLGTVTAITQSGTTTTITTTGGSAASSGNFIYSVPDPATDDESHGLTGHYMITKVDMDSQDLIEVYAVEADKMKSNP